MFLCLSPCIESRLHTFLLSVYTTDTLTHVALIVCWMLGTVGWGESLETACERFSLSASNVTERGGYLHTAFLWLYFAIVVWQLSREVKGGGGAGQSCKRAARERRTKR